MQLKYARILFFMVCALLNSCSKTDHNFNYYLHNLDKLKAEVTDCRKNSIENARCGQLEQYHHQIMTVVLLAQSNPQAFGLDLMQLQRECISQRLELEQLTQHKTNHPNERVIGLQKMNQKIESKINVYLSIIRWLESPEG